MILEPKMDVMFSGIWLWFKSLDQNLDDRMIPASCGEGMYWYSIALLINSLLCIGSDHYDFVDMPSSSDHVVVIPKKLLSHTSMRAYWTVQTFDESFIQTSRKTVLMANDACILVISSLIDFGLVWERNAYVECPESGLHDFKSKLPLDSYTY